MNLTPAGLWTLDFSLSVRVCIYDPLSLSLLRLLFSPPQTTHRVLSCLLQSLIVAIVRLTAVARNTVTFNTKFLPGASTN